MPHVLTEAYHTQSLLSTFIYSNINSKIQKSFRHSAEWGGTTGACFTAVFETVAHNMNGAQAGGYI